MQGFFNKYEVELDEGDAINAIICKAKQAKEYYREDEEYDKCLKELSIMIDDFFKFRDQE